MDKAYQTCPHGKIKVWTGIARPGDRLPAIEHCEICNPGAIALDCETTP